MTFSYPKWRNLCVILLPALNLDVILLQGGEGLDEGFGQTYIRHQRNVVVDGATTDAVAVGQLTLGVVLRHIDDEVELVGGISDDLFKFPREKYSSSQYEYIDNR